MAPTFFSSKNKEQRDNFSFLKSVKIQAFERQQHLCAVCGWPHKMEELKGHHVIPVRHGCVNTVSPNYDFLETVDNCVMVCQACHLYEAHGGHTAFGALAPPEKFEFSHGSSQTFHQLWVEMMTERDSHTCLFWKVSRKKN